MEFIDGICKPFGSNEYITTNGQRKILVTVDRVKKERSQNKWVCFDKKGPYIVSVPYANTKILVPISFCHINDIQHILSYRWAGAYGSQLTGQDAPIDFLCISATEKVWVDYLNHLNHDELKGDVIENMGSLYQSRPVHAKYLHDFSMDADRKGMSRLLSCITRGWIWQEIAFTGPEVTPTGAEPVRLLVELIKTGSEVVRCLIRDGFFKPTDRNVNEVIKFAIDVLWRARNLADNESAYVFFIEESELNKDIIHDAIEQVIAYRTKNDTDDPIDHISMKVLAALDNLENANYSRVEDGFSASFSTLLQSHAEFFGKIDSGKLAPENLCEAITTIVENVTHKHGWDIEWWQQCVVDHPLSQLHHPTFKSIFIQDGNIKVSIEGHEEAIPLRLSYHRPLQGQDLDKSMKSIDGKHDILSLSYRINNGAFYVVGFQTKSMLRVVPVESIIVTHDCTRKVMDVKKSSRWTQTTWYSRDVDWLKVLKRWKDDKRAKSNRIGIFGKR